MEDVESVGGDVQWCPVLAVCLEAELLSDLAVLAWAQQLLPGGPTDAGTEPLGPFVAMCPGSSARLSTNFMWSVP